MGQRLAAVAVSIWDHTQKHVERDWKKALADEKADPDGTQLDQSLSLQPSPKYQHR